MARAAAAGAQPRGGQLTVAVMGMEKSVHALHRACMEAMTLEKMTGTVAFKSSSLKPSP